ncbi:MAG: cytochrome c biogenesis CcdA family protein [Mycobacteriales bacterium]
MSVVDGSLLLAAPVALAAGAVSFLSPCVLPLVPGYLSYMTGLSGADLAAAPTAGPPRRGAVLAGAALFVLGFSAVFTSYGALFGEIGAELRRHQRGIEVGLGLFTIVLGLAFSGLLRVVPWLARELRPHRLPRAGLASAPLLGALFAVGWTPCIGPTLATVLVLSASTDAATAGRGALLTFAYCLGLGVPFLLTAVAFRRALGVFAIVKRHYRSVLAVGGGLLVAVGVLEVTGVWDTLLVHLQTSYTYAPPL